MSSDFPLFRPSKILSALVELKDFEELITKVIIYTSERVHYFPARILLKRWARESEKHSQTCQYIIAYFLSFFTGYCRTCIEELLTPSSRLKILELFETRIEDLDQQELYNFFKRHSIIKSKAEQRFKQIAAMTEDRDIKDILMKISGDKKKHYEEAQQFIGMLEKTYGTQINQ